MELLAGAAAAAWGGGELFSYNRENYMFDKDEGARLEPKDVRFAKSTIL